MRVTVIGAGVFGAWSAKFLADAGHAVTLVDAYGSANGRASSADHTRVIRSGYGADEIYSRWAAEAWHDWEWLAHRTGVPLIARTGALFLGEPGNRYVRDTYDTLTRMGLAAECLAPAEVHRRYPPIATDGLGDVVFERDAGVIRARDAVRSLVRMLAASEGVSYRIDQVEPVDEEGTSPALDTRSGVSLEADAYVFACGPWLPKVFPRAIGARIRPTRQEVLYFGVPAGSDRLSIERLPVWIEFAQGVYGIPDVDGCGFKIGIDRHGPPIDPDTLDRVVDPALVAATRENISRRFPAMRGAPLVEARVCQYENSATGDFIIDRHPQWPQCWIVGAGSGHGFKHGPAVGRHVAALVGGDAAVHPRFALVGRAQTAARSVY